MSRFSSAQSPPPSRQGPGRPSPAGARNTIHESTSNPSSRIPVPPRPQTTSGIAPTRVGSPPAGRGDSPSSNGGRIPLPPPPTRGRGSAVSPPPSPGRNPPAQGGRGVLARPPTTPTNGPNVDNNNKGKRLSISLHTDRQNVAAVVDLPIDETLVSQKEVPQPSSRPMGGSLVNTSSSATSRPGYNRQQPPESFPQTAPVRPLPRPGSTRPIPGRHVPPPSSNQPPPLPPTPTNLPFRPAPGATPSPPPSPKTQTNENGFDPDKHERLRIEALKEMVNTEREYVSQLETGVEVFLKPLKDNPKILPPQDVNALFSNWELLVGVNQEIVNCFDREPDNILVGKAFLSVMQYLKMYKIYCANQPTALKILETQQEENSAFTSFLQERLSNPKCKGQNLFSYLIKPVQRLCKYPLLIKVLLEHTDPSHPDYQSLKQALIEVEEIVTYVNEGKRQAEKSQKILDLAIAIDGGESLSLVTPTRALEMEGNIEVIIKKGKPQPRKIILFNDAVLLVKEAKKGNKLYSLPILMGLGEIKVINVSDTAEFSNGIELEETKTRDKHVLIFTTSEEKQKWLREIKSIVKQYQRRQFEDMQKAEEKAAAAAAASPVLTRGVSVVDVREATLPGGSGVRRPTSMMNVAVKPASKSQYLLSSPISGNSDSASAVPTAKSKGSLLKRRSSFNNKTQISVTKPQATTTATPPPVRYASKPVIPKAK